MDDPFFGNRSCLRKLLCKWDVIIFSIIMTICTNYAGIMINQLTKVYDSCIKGNNRELRWKRNETRLVPPISEYLVWHVNLTANSAVFGSWQLAVGRLEAPHAVWTWNPKHNGDIIMSSEHATKQTESETHHKISYSTINHLSAIAFWDGIIIGVVLLQRALL